MLCAFASCLAPEEVKGSELRYNRDVLPILAGKCFSCHGADRAARKANLRLDERESALAIRAGGARAIVPGAPGERGGEVVLISPTAAVAKVLNGQHSFIKDSGRIHIFENRESAIAGLTEDADSTAALTAQHADVVQQTLKTATAGNQANDTVKEIESTLQCEVITPGSTSVTLAVASTGHFTGKSNGQPYSDVIAGVATDTDVILDATAATFLTDGGVSELLGLAKKTAPQTVHLVVEEGSSVEQSIKTKQLHTMPGINLVNSRDEALAGYLE